jgi:hypothetical protein
MVNLLPLPITIQVSISYNPNLENMTNRLSLTVKFIVLSLTLLANSLLISPAYAQEQCSFVEADCTWDASTDASNYAIKITEVESGTVIKNVTVAASTTKYTFPVTQNKTYRCEVSAVNSCGQSGPAGAGEALCAVDGLVSTPAPTPTPVPSKTPTPTPTPAPQRVCGDSCASSAECKSGLTCLKLPNGQGYCAKPEYQQYCIENPTIASCCEAPPKPTPPPELPKSGLLDNTITVAVAGVVLVGIAAVLLVL